MNTSHSQTVSNVTKRFFQNIASRQWTNAQALIHQHYTVTPTKDEEWKVGYITALQGMLTARRNNQTEHPPFILHIEGSSNIDALKTYFHEQIQHPLNTEFDKGFFQTWYEYIPFLKSQ